MLRPFCYDLIDHQIFIMAHQRFQCLYQELSCAEAEMLIGGLSSVGEDAATFSRSRNNRGGNQTAQDFPGAKSRWLALPLNQLALQPSELSNVREAFDAG